MVNAEKLQELMLAIAAHSRVKSLGLTKLWKLVYFADVRALRELGSSITGSEFVKYPHGPVPSRGVKHLKKLERAQRIQTSQEKVGPYLQTAVRALDGPKKSSFSKQELVIIEQVCKELGAKTASELSKLSHDEPAWALASDLDKLDEGLMHYGESEDPEGL